jgi:hypothetical protein
MGHALKARNSKARGKAAKRALEPRALLRCAFGAGLTPTLVLHFLITATSVGGIHNEIQPDDFPLLIFRLIPFIKPPNPSGAGGEALSASLLDLDDVPASPAVSLLASEASASGAYVGVIRKCST